MGAGRHVFLGGGCGLCPLLAVRFVRDGHRKVFVGSGPGFREVMVIVVGQVPPVELMPPGVSGVPDESVWNPFDAKACPANMPLPLSTQTVSPSGEVLYPKPGCDGDHPS